MHDTHPRPARRGRAAPRSAAPRERRHAARHPQRARVAFGTLALLAITLSLPALVRADDAAGRASPDGASGASRDVRHPGTGTLVLGPPGAEVDALLLDTRFALDVQGLLGSLTLTQTFANTTDRWLDGTYLFPLPADAAVRGLELRVGDRVVVGRVTERAAARDTYERARANGQVAGLVEQQRPNLFTARLASIAPDSEIRVTLDVLLPVAASDERLSLTLPTTLTPRYANGHADDPRGVTGTILPARAIRGPRFSLDARIRPLADPSLVSGGTHRLDVDGDRVTVSDAPMDRDLVLAWPFAEGTAPSGEAFVATHRGERYAQLFMAPPEAVEDDAPARELVLVVDTSGSMAGTSIVAARAAVQGALDGLRPDDTFELIAFDDDTRSAFDGPRPATAANLVAARRFVRALEADGGTEMAPALVRALAPVRGARGDRRERAFPGDERADSAAETATSDARRLRQIVFLTDGSIADEARLLTLIRQGIGRARLFAVGIGSAPNGWFLDKAAEVGRGTALAIRDLDDVRDVVSDLLGRLERPVLTDIEVQFPDGGGESYPARVPDLYADAPLMVVARLEGEGGEAIVTGRRGDERVVRRITLPGAGDPEPSAEGAAPSLAMHWARAKVDALLDEQRESRDDERHRDAITALALEVGLVTPYTSFVAIEKRPVRAPATASTGAEVANLLPHGSAMTTFAMPQGAAGIDTLGLVAALAALLGSWLLHLGHRRPRPDGGPVGRPSTRRRPPLDRPSAARPPTGRASGGRSSTDRSPT